ncbi:uncharacterized protein LOC122278525 [Carya illinoinensis]|uniref:uncharacterized protein LOC122278525 n=1 Tax=Carya illinoinensis TaxID=32201 RepID=UPI001C726584|nr:uncharacterized protein LOC122278525 [Carya illinoinensis]
MDCEGCFVVDARGSSGGLALLWKKNVSVEVTNFTQHHISVMVGQDVSKAKWLLTSFYGHPKTSKRKSTWNILSSLKPVNNQGWCVIGDFNEIVSQSEKVGGKERPEGQMDEFRHCLEDRRVETLIARQSDHKPILLIIKEFNCFAGYRRRLFRFEAKWTLEEEGRNIVEAAWVRDNASQNILKEVQGKLRRCRGELIKWNSLRVPEGEKEISRLSELLEKEQKGEGAHNALIIRRLQKELGLLLGKEDLKWKQRAKRNWYKLGDRNTKFFHECATQRKKKNCISEIQDANGVRVADQKGIEEVFSQYFRNLFNSSNPSPEAIEEGLRGVERRVTDAMNSELQKVFVMPEVEAALKEMGPLKSPGPDGYGAYFYQTYWSVVGQEVCQAVLSFLNGKCELDCNINFTHIALIPKVEKPVVASEYRPISLCNVLYKIVSKVLANILKKVLPEVILKNQSAFIPSRLITDNVMVAYETLHTMKTRQKGRVGSMALKLDISKAYDRIEWGFLDGVMRKLGFGDKWVKLVMDCVTSVTYSSLVNGQPSSIIKPSRGIRQGDPISPYLFILCAEGLSSLVDMAERNGEIKGVAITRGGIRVNHLLFADDSVIYGRAKLIEWKLCKEIIVVMARFWWSHMQNDKRVHWRSWSKMGDSKGRGGLGFRELKCFNKAMLAKQVWRILNNPNSLVARVMQEKYFKGKSVLDAKLGYSPSLIWRSLFSYVGLIKDGLSWRVGDGNVIKIWKDRWVPSSSSHLLQSPMKMLPAEATIKQLIKEGSGKWNKELINEIFNKEEAEAIGNIPLSKMGTKDKMRIRAEKGESSTMNADEFGWKSIWKLKVQAASDVWAENDSPVHKWACSAGHFMELWKQINSCLEEDGNIEDFKTVNNPSKPDRVDRRLIRWKKPDAMICKVNWDAALDVKNKQVAIGIIVRDSEGEILACLCSKLSIVVKAIVAEAYALRRALFFCLELGLQKVLLEGDSQVVVKDTNSNADIWANYGVVIEDIRSLLKDNMSWSVNFIHREANNVAHSLAKMALTCDEEIVWMEEGPPQIMNAVLKEKYCND